MAQGGKVDLGLEVDSQTPSGPEVTISAGAGCDGDVALEGAVDDAASQRRGCASIIEPGTGNRPEPLPTSGDRGLADLVPIGRRHQQLSRLLAEG